MHPSFRLIPVLLGLPGGNQKLVLTSHTERGLLRDSNSCLPTAPANPALLGAADGDPEHHATATVDGYKTKNYFFELSKFRLCEFGETNPIPSR